MSKTARKIDVGRCVRTACAAILLCAALGALLWGVNALTAGRIQQEEQERRRVQLQAVMPGAEAFSEIPFDRTRADEVLAAVSGTQLQGYCVTVTVQGFNGPMEVLVGVNENGSVTGVLVVEDRETPEAGKRATESTFLNQFLGKSGTVRVNQGNNAVEAVSGATISSRAVTEGVNRALSVVANLHTEGGELDEEGDV